MGRKALSYKFVKKQFEKRGFLLLSEKYNNNLEKLKYSCNNRHISNITYSDLKKGHGCKKCYDNSRRISLDFIKKEVPKIVLNYKCIANKYKNCETKIPFKCDKNHIFYMSWSNFRRGQRCGICHRENCVGENHHQWKGGISCEPYCPLWLDKEYKKDIKKRDNYTCQNKDCWETSKRLCIHHINYNKKDCHPNNLITICISCNSRANKNRNYWELYYENIIRES